MATYDYKVSQLRNTPHMQGIYYSGDNVMTTSTRFTTTQTITGVWANYTANQYIAKDFVGMAIICDTNGNVLTRGSSISFTVPQEQGTKHWYFLPLDTPFIATAETNYWVGTQRMDGYNNAEFTDHAVSSESSNLYDGTSHVFFGLPGKRGNSYTDSQTTVNQWSTDTAFAQAIGVQLRSPDTTPPTGYSMIPQTVYANAVSKTDEFFMVQVNDDVGVTSVKFPTWGASGGQNDIVWYEGIDNGNGIWVKSINFNSHDGGIDQRYYVHVYAYDAAGNNAFIAGYDVYVDTIAPLVPTQTNMSTFANSSGASWTAFSDGAQSSGLYSTTIHLQSWNGSTWTYVSTYPKNVTGTTHGFTGLTQNTQYRWGVVYRDNAGNQNALNYTTFTTNALAVCTVLNLTSSGYILNQRPKMKFTATDANGSALSNFQIQISRVSDYATTVIDTASGTSSVGWSSTSSASGGTIYYTPQTNLGYGLLYIRLRAYDGIEWGSWSTTITFTIQTISYPTTIVADDTAISKRTIDDIRARVNAVRQARGLSVFTWTDATINDWNNVSPTSVRVIHLTELRQAIAEIYTPLSLPAPTWTDTTITTSTDRKGIHWSEMRNSLLGC